MKTLNLLIPTVTKKEDLRLMYPNSQFLYRELDDCIVGIEARSKSVVYHKGSLIESIMKIEYPRIFSSLATSEEYDRIHELIFDRLWSTDMNVGYQDLSEFINGETNYPIANPICSCLSSFEIVQNLG